MNKIINTFDTVNIPMLLGMEQLNKSVILDVGTGSGIMARTLTKEGAFVVTIDKSSKANQSALEMFKRIPVNLTRPLLINMDSARMNFFSESFDYVVCYRALHHIKEYHQTLIEMNRVCREGGKVYIIELNSRTHKAINFYNNIIGKEAHADEVDLDTVSNIMIPVFSNVKKFTTVVGEVIVGLK